MNYHNDTKMENKYDIFISYSRKDFDEVNRFVGMQKECIIRSFSSFTSYSLKIGIDRKTELFNEYLLEG